MATDNSWVDVAPGDRSPRGILALLILFLGSLLLAAMVAPSALRAVRALAELWPTRLTLYLAEKDLPRYFDRLRWLAVLAGLPWVAWAAGIRSWTSLGLRFDRGRRRRAVSWLLLGFLMVAAMSLAQILLGGAGLRSSSGFGTVLETAFFALLSALFVGLLEELVFRGVVLRAFLQATASTAWAVFLASSFFALAHFQRVPSHEWAGESVPTLADGIRVAGASLTASVFDIRWELAPGLFLGGSILCLVALNARSLIPAMALHGGWVWAALLHRRLVEPAGDGASRLWGGKALLDGLVPLILLATLLGVLAYRWWRRNRPGSDLDSLAPEVGG